MATKYSIPSVKSICEDSSDDEIREEVKNRDVGEVKRLDPRIVHAVVNENVGRETEQSRRKYKSGSKHSKREARNAQVKGATGSSKNGEHGESRLRRRRRHSIRGLGFTSPGGGETTESYRSILAARSRFTSPSMVSMITTQTAVTSKSSSSSGSNSTVTQASVTKRSISRKKPEVEEAGEKSDSLAVPDPPYVFQFLENDGSPQPESEPDEDEEEDDESEAEEEKEGGNEKASHWQQKQIEDSCIESAPTHQQHASTSSSASSSFHGDDNLSEAAADMDTDRSSSPERSERGHDLDLDAPPPADQALGKVAFQIAAAQERQKIHGSTQPFKIPNLPCLNTQSSAMPPSTLSGGPQYQMQHHPHPRLEQFPATGYELLASRLSDSRASEQQSPSVKPLYRKFAALNHRLLLYLQDELSELEEQLQLLDQADTQSRVIDMRGHIVPASRRLAAQAGGELQWHKTDILGKIGFKLAQYNQALSSFHGTQSLASPSPEDIELYRAYLQTEQPVVETETRFLNPAHDLVCLASSPPQRPPTPHSRGPSSSSTLPSSSITPPSSHSSPHLPPTHQLPPILPSLASALAITTLVPILTFGVIPGFAGRVVVALLVAAFMGGALVQSEMVESRWMLGREGCRCMGVYLGVMVVLAGIV